MNRKRKGKGKSDEGGVRRKKRKRWRRRYREKKMCRWKQKSVNTPPFGVCRADSFLLGEPAEKAAATLSSKASLCTENRRVGQTIDSDTTEEELGNNLNKS